MASDMERRLSALEEEFKVLKAEMRQTMVDIRAFLMQMESPLFDRNGRATPGNGAPRPSQEAPSARARAEASLEPVVVEEEEPSPSSPPGVRPAPPPAGAARPAPSAPPAEVPHAVPGAGPVYIPPGGAGAPGGDVLGAMTAGLLMGSGLGQRPQREPASQASNPVGGAPSTASAHGVAGWNLQAPPGSLPGMPGGVGGGPATHPGGPWGPAPSPLFPPLDMNLLAGLVRWVVRARRLLGAERLSTLLGLYAFEAYGIPGLREVVLRLAEMVGDQEAEHDTWTDLLLQLHGILTGGSGRPGPA